MARKLRKVKLKDLPADERPRERLLRLGHDSLNNAELLALVLGTGSKKENVLSLANRLLAKYDISELSAASLPEFMHIFGISHAKACSLIAAFELGRRAQSHQKPKSDIANPADIANRFMPNMYNAKREALMCVCLDSKAHVIKHTTISIGSLNTNNVHPREVFRPAIEDCAAGIVLVHNHPSGDPTPSERDIAMTKRLEKAGKLLGIEVLDHIIIGNHRYVSLKEENLM